MLIDKYDLVHISTGDLLRAAVKAGTEIGKQAGALMEAGQLVPDALIIRMVKERIAQPDCVSKGWLLDGFPRTEAQADALMEAGIECDAFIYLKVPDEMLVERVVGRRTDPVTNMIYHLKFSPPPEDEAVLSRLVHRADDTEETCVARLEQFHSHIGAVRSKFASIMHEIDGTQNKHAVFKDITEKLDEALEEGEPVAASITVPVSGSVSVKLTLSPDYYKSGGEFEPEEPSDEERAVGESEMVKHEALKELHRLHQDSEVHHFTEQDYQDHFDSWEIVTYAEEHVPFGTNYFFKIRIAPNRNIHIRVHRQQHEAKYNFHSLHKTIKHNVETCIWHDDEPLTYFES
jgi:adenylate kinase